MLLFLSNQNCYSYVYSFFDFMTFYFMTFYEIDNDNDKDINKL